MFKSPNEMTKTAVTLHSEGPPDSSKSKPKSKSGGKGIARSKPRVPLAPDTDELTTGTAAQSECIDTTKPLPPNLRPNPEGHVPQAFGLLDFQDIALFLWPPYRQHPGFELEEQCVILKHRNPKLKEITNQDLVEIKEWMSQSDYITVEEDSVDICEWRLCLSEDELSARAKQMDEDLKREVSMMIHSTWATERSSASDERRQRLAAIIETSRENEE